MEKAERKEQTNRDGIAVTYKPGGTEKRRKERRKEVTEEGRSKRDERK